MEQPAPTARPITEEPARVQSAPRPTTRRVGTGPGASVTSTKPIIGPGESHGRLPGHAPDTRRTLPVDNFRAPGSAACLRRAAPYHPVSPCSRTLSQAEFAPSWRNQCARMAQFRELAGTPGAGIAVPYGLASVSLGESWRARGECVKITHPREATPSHPQAPLRPSGSQPVGTPKPPGSHPQAPLRLHSGSGP
jgi:hypothetical protein